jgi:hypothetical protein
MLVSPNIAIVVVGYNRKDSLSRLLMSIQNASYQEKNDIDLIISLDFSGKDDCWKTATQFEWHHGTKKIIRHDTKLGLKSHIISCGNLTLQYDAIILLEDDLYVSKYFYEYAVQSVTFYNNDSSIAGIGLYNYRFNEFELCQFEPITDDYDNYFLKIPCSWGQIWTTQQWKAFVHFLDNYTIQENLFLPSIVNLWPRESSWKRFYFEYMIIENKYFVYPRVSLSTNFGDPGQHFEDSVAILQTPLLMSEKNFTFCRLEDSNAVYDAFFELEEGVINKLMKTNLSISFDLNGSKPIELVSTEFLVSGKKCSNPIKSYSSNLYPYECNVINNMFEKNTNMIAFSFGKTKDFTNEKNFYRVNADIKRFFINSNSLLKLGREEIMRSTRYKFGDRLLSPILRVKKTIVRFFKPTNKMFNWFF